MKLYRVEVSDYYENYDLKESCYEIERKFDEDQSLLEEWGCKELEVSTKKKKGDLGYCISFCNSLILKENSYQKLKDIFVEDVELLPLAFGDEIWYLVHGIKIEKEINYDVSGCVVEYRTFYNGPKEQELCNKYYFKVCDEYGIPSEMIFTEKFVDLVKELHLKGVDFTESGEILEE